MKQKIRIAIGWMLALLAVTAAGCASKESPPALRREGYLCHVTVSAGKTEATGTLRLPGGGVAECTFSAPESVRGLSVTLSGETVSLSYGELSWQGNTEKLSASFPLTALAEALYTAAVPTKGEDGWRFGGTGRCGSWVLTVDEEGYPQYFSAAGGELTLRFADFLPLSSEK